MRTVFRKVPSSNRNAWSLSFPLTTLFLISIVTLELKLWRQLTLAEKLAEKQIVALTIRKHCGVSDRFIGRSDKSNRNSKPYLEAVIHYSVPHMHLCIKRTLNILFFVLLPVSKSLVIPTCTSDIGPFYVVILYLRVFSIAMSTLTIAWQTMDTLELHFLSEERCLLTLNEH